MTNLLGCQLTGNACARTIGFVKTIRDGQPTTPIVIISPIFSAARENDIAAMYDTMSGEGVEAFKEGFAFTLVEMRAALKDMVAVLRRAGDTRIWYRDGLSLFDKPDADAGMLPDDLHPDGAGYELMGRRFASLEFGKTGRLLPGRMPGGSSL
jgi:lysophospholipase L1-like esterase